MEPSENQSLKLPRLMVQPDGTAKLYLLAADTHKGGTTVECFTEELSIPRAIARLLDESEEAAVAAYNDEDESGDFWDWIEDVRGNTLDTFQTDEATYLVDPTPRVQRLEDLLLKAFDHLCYMANILPAGIMIDMARSGQDEAAQQIVKEVDRIRAYRKQHGSNPNPV
jgi:hypothetical protein